MCSVQEGMSTVNHCGIRLFGEVYLRMLILSMRFQEDSLLLLYFLYIERRLASVCVAKQQYSAPLCKSCIGS